MSPEPYEVAWERTLVWNAGDGVWCGRKLPEDYDVRIAGSSDSVNTAMLNAARSWVPRAQELRDAAARFLSGRDLRGGQDGAIRITHTLCSGKDVDLFGTDVPVTTAPRLLRRSASYWLP